MTICIKVNNIVKSYGKISQQNAILNGINLTIESGTIYALIGSSGCGKTTLLSCILGTEKFQNGEIKVFGHQVLLNRISRFSNLIGYMPQQISLSSSLSVIETLKYFGNLHAMNCEIMEERIEMMKDLLQLPSDDSMIPNLSGGQKRRVSLAVAILHDPKLLILDEPTVGLDFVLRDRIWSFLVEQKITVLITTHYLSEAAKAHQCGFMRNGVLLASGKPSNITQQLDVETLDEAFYKLSLMQDDRSICEAVTDTSKTEVIEKLEESESVRSQVVSALLVSEFHRFRRQPFEIFYLSLFVIIQYATFGMIIGAIPKDLKLGIVNYEGNCTKNVSILASCEFVNRLDGFKLINYESEAEAKSDFHNSKLFAIIEFQKNFTESLIEYEDEISHINSTMMITLDNSKLYLVLFIKAKLFDAFQDLVNNLSNHYNIKKHLLLRPIKIEEAMYAPLNYEVRISPAVIMSITIPFGAALSFATIFFAVVRREGVWNRSIVSGMRTLEFVFAYLIECMMLSIVYSFQVLVCFEKINRITIVGSFGAAFFLIFLNAIIGYLMGFLISTLLDDVIGSMLLAFGLNIIIIYSSGIMWPIEGAHPLLRYISEIQPIHSSADALRNIMIKGVGVSHFVVLKAFAITISYIFMLLYACFITLKHKKLVKIIE